ncbi:hypothetical protein [Calidithermus roseus]|uniref:Serine hydrolase n=1 Tax=Calidithermus roseus TaxID=1644118 RepID=A0A399EZ20_9DEIN|nr:hypothetical protein [Calidithermus roseus]RIH89268.1 hypothetical protein Mrose_00408 [Calidithermus roseus]
MQKARLILILLVAAYFALTLRPNAGQTTPAPITTAPARQPIASTDWRQEFSTLWARAEQQGYVIAFEPWPAGGGGLLMVYNSGTLVATTSAPYDRLVLTLERLVN